MPVKKKDTSVSQTSVKDYGKLISKRETKREDYEHSPTSGPKKGKELRKSGPPKSGLKSLQLLQRKKGLCRIP